MMLDERVMKLIAGGASFSANCQPCLQANAAEALESGANDQEIAEAIWVGGMVRRGAATKMEELATSLSQAIPPTSNLSNEGCRCK